MTLDFEAVLLGSKRHDFDSYRSASAKYPATDAKRGGGRRSRKTGAKMPQSTCTVTCLLSRLVFRDVSWACLR